MAAFTKRMNRPITLLRKAMVTAFRLHLRNDHDPFRRTGAILPRIVWFRARLRTSTVIYSAVRPEKKERVEW